jgi:hypothetical protein
LKKNNDLKRINKEREIKKKFEELEELKKIMFKKALEESKDKHNAATLISLLYRVCKAKKIFKNKKNQINLELLHKKEKKFIRSIVLFQKFYRFFSIKNWLYFNGIKFHSYKLNIKKIENKNRKNNNKIIESKLKKVNNSIIKYKNIDKRKILTKTDVQNRIDVETSKKLLFDRKKLFSKLQHDHVNLLQVLILIIFYLILLLYYGTSQRSYIINHTNQ